jgi:hypothetical protein
MHSYSRQFSAGLLALLALVAPAGFARAEPLVSALVGDGRPGNVLEVGESGSPIAFGSGPGEADEGNEEAVEAGPATTLNLLAAILAVPAGTTATTSSSPDNGSDLSKSSSTTNGSQDPNDPSDPGGGGTTTSLAPEPGSLWTALTGASLLGLEVLRRRRRLLLRLP